MIVRAFASLLVLALLTGLPAISHPTSASQPPAGLPAQLQQATDRSPGQGIRAAGNYHVAGRVKAAGAVLANPTGEFGSVTLGSRAASVRQRRHLTVCRCSAPAASRYPAGPGLPQVVSVGHKALSPIETATSGLLTAATTQ